MHFLAWLGDQCLSLLNNQFAALIVSTVSLLASVKAVELSRRNLLQQPKLHEALRRQNGIDALDGICNDILDAARLEFKRIDRKVYEAHLEMIDVAKEHRIFSEARRCLWQVDDQIEPRVNEMLGKLMLLRDLLKGLLRTLETSSGFDAAMKRFPLDSQPIVARTLEIQEDLRNLGLALFRDALAIKRDEK